MSLDLNKCIVRNSKDSGVDVDATVTKVRLTCEKHNANQENDLSVIEAAVYAVFDRFPGSNLNMDALKGFVAQELKATPSTYALVAKRTEEYVKSWANTRFTIKKGIGNGVSRIVPPLG